MAVDVGKFYISFGIDASSFTEEMVRAEAVASGSARNIKDKLASLAGSLNALRSEAKQVREQLSTVGNFNVRGSESLDKLHDVLFGVREAGAATDKTLDDLSLRFEDASRGARSYVQALDRIASDKTASQSVRDLARALSDEAKEANADAAALQKRATALERQIASQSRAFGSSLRQAGREQNKPAAPAAQDESHGVPPQAAASAAVRALSGTASVRAGERFLTDTLGLGGALQGAFPLIGGAAILTEMVSRGEQLYETFTKLQEAPARLAQEFRQLNAPLQEENDQLDLANAKLENELAKLSGRPQNSLKEAIFEARLEVDKLADSLDKAFDDLQKLLSKNEVGFFRNLLTGQAQTKDLTKEFGGGEGGDFLGTGFPGRVQQIVDRGQADLAKINPGTTEAEKKAAVDAKNVINTRIRNELEREYGAELGKVNIELEQARKLQAQTTPQLKNPTVPFVGQSELGQRAAQEFKRGDYGTAALHELSAVVPVVGPGLTALTDATVGKLLPAPQQQRILELQAVQRRLVAQQAQVGKRFRNEDLTAQVEEKRVGEYSAGLTRPYTDKIAELRTQLGGLQSELAAIGLNPTGEILAKSFAKAQQEATKLNDELAKHHQSLTLDQEVEIQTVNDQIALTTAEKEFRSRFEQTTTSISTRINALRTLSTAVGQGYAAQRGATVENQLSQEFSAEYRDPELLRRRQPQIQQRRVQLSTEFDQQQSLQNTQTLDKLSDQVSLENALAAAELQGSEAVRQVTLADRAANLEKDRGIEAGRQLAQSERALSDAQVRRRTTQAVEQLEQEIAATNNLTAAQSRGAEAVRQAQVENRITEIRRSTPAGPEQDRQIQDVRSQAAAQHQQEIVTNAVQAGNAFKDQLTSLNEQIGYLERIKVSHQGTLVTEISLKSLEQQRVDLIARQSLIFGNARDGMRAFFSEMATGTQSAAQQVHDTLGQAFESLNDTLARLVSGQKVSWASFFQGISANLAKMALHNIEAQIAAKLFPPANPQLAGQTTPPQGHFGTIRQGIGGLIRGSSQPQPWDEKIHLANPSLTGRTRDGQTPGTALFVTGISSQPSSAAPTLPVIPALPANGPQLSQIPSIVRTSEETRGVAPGGNAGDILTRLPSGLIQRQSANGGTKPSLGGNADLNAGDLANLGDFAPSEIGQLAKSGTVGSSIGGANAAAGPVSGLASTLGRALGKPGASGILKTLLSAFGGFRETGGPVNGGEWHVVGEDGPEVFVPDSGGQILPNKQLKWLSKLLHHQNKAEAAAEKETLQNTLTLVQKTPRAFNRTRSASQFRDVSLPNTPAGNQWADFVEFAQFGVKTLSAISKSGGGSGGGGSSTGSFGESSSSASSRPDPNENYNLTRLDSGLILREPKQFADLSAEDHANLGDFQNSELGQLDNSSEGTYPDLGMQQSGGVLSGPSGGSGESNGNGALNLGLLGASVGLGIIQMIMNRPKDHHHKAGHSYSIPNFNGAYAEGGDVKGGMTHLVGEQGPELFVPKADGMIIPHDKLNSFRQFSDNGTSQGVSKLAAISAAKPFAGYRALGGAVDAGSPYVVGEQGSELWTSSSAISDSIAPNGGIGSPSGSGGITIYQDNRGSDPALMEQKTRQGLQAVHKASVRTSFQSWQEYQKRTPQTK
jgi:hypothetical protein